MNRNLIVLVALLMAWAMSRPTIHAATITWTNTSGGNWSATNNWSPNQVPTNTDNVLITTPGTYTVTLDGYGSVANLTLGAGGGAFGVQTFAVISQSLVATNSLLVTGGGVLNASGNNAGLSGATTVANGGILNLAAGYQNSYFVLNPLIVTNGGMLNAGGRPNNNNYYSDYTFYGAATVANGGVFTANGAWPAGVITVAHGGVLNIANGLYLVSPLLNSGTINLTNTWITIDNYYSAEDGRQDGNGGVVNQPGGLINFQGNSSIGGVRGVYQETAYDYFINQGIMTQSGGTNSIDCQVFDNSQGTITNLAGTMVLGTYQTNLAGIYFAAAGATIQFNAVNIGTNFVTAGTPLVLAGSGQYQLMSGNLYYPSNTIPNLALQGTLLVLGPGFQGGAITNLALDGIGLSNSLPVTGTFSVTNSSVLGNFTVANGGIFAGSNAATYGSVTVANGGLFIANGGSANTLGYPSYSGSLTVAHGGAANLAGNFGINAPLTNAGTVNISNAAINVNVGIINQAGGLMNLGTNVGIYVANPNGYFINRGMVVQIPGAGGTTNTISCPASAQVGNQQISINLAFAFDNSQGTITNFSGTLALPGFRTNLAGTFYAAAGTTIQLGGGTAATPLMSGTPLVLGGSGQYQFYSGYLYLPNTAIPNLSLQAGLLELGPGFQGGAITNLVLAGIALTNQLSTTLPIKGTFTVLNTWASLNNFLFVGWDGFYGTGVYGDYTVTDGGVMTVSNSLMQSSVTVANGGIFNDGATVNGTVTVAGGGALNANGALMNGAMTVATGGMVTAIGGGAVINRGSSLTMAPGSTMNMTGSSIGLNGPLNNSGTINMTNSGIEMYNDGTTNYTGSLINQAGGLIDFSGSGDIGGYGGYDYVANQGQIIDDSAGSGYTVFDADNATNSGTITVQKGQLFLAGPWTLLPAGSLNVVLNSATNYGNIFFASQSGPFGASAVLAGAFNATFNNGYVPTNGTTFNVLTYGSFTGSFSSLGLPSAVSWQSNYGSTNFTLVAGSAMPQFGTFNLSGTNLIFNGTGGSPGSNYVVLASTNLTIPLTNWLALTTNTFDGSGQFHYTNNVNPAKPQQFYIFKLP